MHLDEEAVSASIKQDDEERLLRHKGDLPTTQTDTNFIELYLGEDDYTTSVSTTRSRNWI